jgi:hypothetical protein
MEPGRLSQILTIYAWFPLAGLLAILALIARFFEVQTQVRTRYQAYSAPIILFGLAAAYYASIGQVMGDRLGEVLLALGGGTLAVLCVQLYRRMLARR